MGYTRCLIYWILDVLDIGCFTHLNLLTYWVYWKLDISIGHFEKIKRIGNIRHIRLIGRLSTWNYLRFEILDMGHIEH